MAERYARCKIKNIATLNTAHEKESPEHIELVSTLPDDCIRINTGTKEWCEMCRECGWV